LSDEQVQKTVIEQVTEDIWIRPEKSLQAFQKSLNKLGWKTNMTPIPVDFIIFTNKECPIAIERKTTNDFLRSIRDGSLVEQLRAMRGISDDAYILLEGSWSWMFSQKNPYRSHMNESSVVGYIDVVDKFGVKIIPVNNQTWSVAWIDKRLRDLKGKEKKLLFKLRGSASKDLSSAEQAEYIVSGLPGLGPVGLIEIKTICKNADEFFDWLHQDHNMYEDLFKFSTRIKNLKPKWKSIMEANWHGKV